MEAKDYIKAMRLWVIQEHKHCEDMLCTQFGDFSTSAAFYNGQMVAYCEVLDYLYWAMKKISEEEKRERR